MKSFSSILTCVGMLLATLSACTPATAPAAQAPTPAATQPAAQAAAPTSTPPATQAAAPTATQPATQAPSPTATQPLPPPDANTGLRELATPRGFYIGAAVQAGFLANEPAYRETVLKEFNMITPEWEMKMCVIWPERDRWDFTLSDRLVAFAEENGLRLRGHTLVWIDCEPEWIRQGSFSKEEATALLKEYITTVVGRYKGKIAYWDVLNETLYRSAVWNRLIGPEYVELAFQWAHEADPDALLFYNDFNAEEVNPKSNDQFMFVKTLLAKGVPLHGVGLQMHIKGGLKKTAVAANIQRLNELGLEVHITEFDVPLSTSAADPLQRQAEVYRDMLELCLSAQNCPVFTIWGFTDKYSWLHSVQNQPGANPLIFDAEYRRKPAYDALYWAFAGH